MNRRKVSFSGHPKNCPYNKFVGNKLNAQGTTDEEARAYVNHYYVVKGDITVYPRVIQSRY